MLKLQIDQTKQVQIIPPLLQMTFVIYFSFSLSFKASITPTNKNTNSFKIMYMKKFAVPLTPFKNWRIKTPNFTV